MTIFLILLALAAIFVLWLRRLWLRDPLRVLRFIFRVPKPRKENTGQRSRDSGGFRRRSRRKDGIIPKEYAVDVEYVETKDYSSGPERIHEEKREEYHESQVSDAEWEDIK